MIAPGVRTAIVIHPSASAKTPPEKAFRAAIEEARRLYRDLDVKSSGEVGQINKSAGKSPVAASAALLMLLKVCHQIYETTGGVFDVVRGSTKRGKGPFLMVNFETGETRLDKGSRLDLTGIRKGYVVDRMAGLLKSHGFTNFMIQAGEITRTMGRDGTNYWRLNIADPNGSKRELCRVSLENAGLATADVRDLRGAVARLGKNIEASRDLRSVTVITKNATNATALATTALLVGRDEAHKMFTPLLQRGFGVILEDKTGKIKTLGDVTAACFEE